MYNYSEKVLISLRRIIRAVSIYSKNILYKYSLTVPQLILLKEIELSGKITVGNLAKKVSLSSATVSDVIYRLKGKKLIYKRRSSSDRRKVFIYLTSKGKEVLGNAPPLLQEKFIEKFEMLNNEEKERLYSSISKIAYMMDAEDLDVEPILFEGFNNIPDKSKDNDERSL